MAVAGDAAHFQQGGGDGILVLRCRRLFGPQPRCYLLQALRNVRGRECRLHRCTLPTG